MHSRIIQLLDNLEGHLQWSAGNLIEHNVRGSVDFALFLDDLQDEQHDLDLELERKGTYLAKLNQDIADAQATENSAELDWTTAKSAREAEQQRCQEESEEDATRI